MICQAVCLKGKAHKEKKIERSHLNALDTQLDKSRCYGQFQKTWKIIYEPTNNFFTQSCFYITFLEVKFTTFCLSWDQESVKSKQDQDSGFFEINATYEG